MPEGRFGDVARLLVARGADVHARDHDGQTPLHRAAADGATETIAMLLAKGARAGESDADDVTPLHLAAVEGRRDVVELLAVAGADVNARDNDGDAPLHEAARRGHRGIVDYLLARNAKSDSTIEDLLKTGVTPLHQAAATGDLRRAKSLIADGANVNAKDRAGGRPLYYAAEKGDKEMVELLVAHGAVVDRLNTRRRDTPLDAATREGHEEIVQFLTSQSPPAGSSASDEPASVPE